MSDRPLRFAALGLDHRHIYGMAENMQDVGGEFVGWWTKGDSAPWTVSTNAFPK